jgi:hypothetical protein
VRADVINSLLSRFELLLEEMARKAEASRGMYVMTTGTFSLCSISQRVRRRVQSFRSKGPRSRGDLQLRPTAPRSTSSRCRPKTLRLPISWREPPGRHPVLLRPASVSSIMQDCVERSKEMLSVTLVSDVQPLETFSGPLLSRLRAAMTFRRLGIPVTDLFGCRACLSSRHASIRRRSGCFRQQ